MMGESWELWGNRGNCGNLERYHFSYTPPSTVLPPYLPLCHGRLTLESPRSSTVAPLLHHRYIHRKPRFTLCVISILLRVWEFSRECRIYTLMRFYTTMIPLWISVALLLITGDWLSCYYMISGGSAWCEPILELLAL